MTSGINGASFIQIRSDQMTEIEGYAQGVILKGHIIEKNEEGTSLQIEGKDYQVPKSVEVVEDLGESASFEVVSSKGGPTVLKYIRPYGKTEEGSFSDANKQVQQVKKVDHSYARTIQEVSSKLSESDRALVSKMVEEAEAVLKDISRQVTDGDMAQMFKDGLDPEKTSLEIVARVLSHNKPLVREQNMAGLEKAVSEALIEVESHYEDTEKLELVIRSLSQEAVPVTTKNIDRLMAAIATVDQIKSLESEGAVQFIKAGEASAQEVTLKDAYKMLHSPNNDQTQVTIDDLSLETMVKDFLVKQGMPLTEEAIDAAKALVKQGIPLTKDKIEFVAQPQKVTQSIEIESLAKEMVQRIGDNGEPRDVAVEALQFIVEGSSTEPKVEGQSYLEINDQAIKETIQWLPKVKDAHLVVAQIQEKTNNLDQIIQVSKSIEGSSNGSSDLRLETLPELEKSLQLKRQVEEIRLKMTLEVALRMEEKGISVTTAPLEEVVEGLKAEENRLHNVQLQSYGPDLTQDQQEVYKTTMSALKDLTSVEEDTYGHLLKNQAMVTIDNVTQASEALKVQQVTTAYESSMTEIRPDLGDKIEAAFDQIDPILEDLGLPVTEENVQAVKILARNSMPLTEDNILEIQLTHEKIDLITAKMNPLVVVKMIQADINPIQLSVDELTAFMTAYEEENAMGLEDGIARLIHDLDRTDALTSEERQSMMAVYRTFDTVVRSKGAATGFLVKNDLPLTVNHLFEAAKYIRTTKGVNSAIASDIDDDFGVLKEVTNSEAAIKNQAGSALSETEGLGRVRQALMDLRVETFVRNLSSHKSQELVTSSERDVLEDKPLKALTELMETWSEIEDSPILKAEKVHSYLQFVKTNPDVLKTFVEKQMPLTMENFDKAMAMNEDGFLLLHDLEQAVEAIEDPTIKGQVLTKLGETGQAILAGESSYEALEETMSEIRDLLGTVAQEENPSVYRQVDGAKATVRHTQMIQITEDYYQIPVMMDGQMTQLNLYMMDQNSSVNSDASNMKVLMSFSTANLGKVQALVELKGNQAALTIQSENQEDRPVLTRFEEDFRQVMGLSNFNVNEVHYKTIDEKEPVEISKAAEIQKAKTMVNGRIDWSI